MAKINPMREHIEKWKESGDSMTAYCKENEISYDSFRYWKEKYETEAIRLNKQGKATNSFIPIEFRDEEDNLKTILEIRIESDGKMLLRIGRQ